jgi:cytochrome c biogenesis protein CcdA
MIIQKYGTFFIILYTIVSAHADSDTASVTLTFFGSPTCKICMSIKKEILWPAAKRHPSINVKVQDITTDSGYTLLMDLEERHKVPVSSAITLFFPDTFLSGGEDIKKLAPALIERYAGSSMKKVVGSQAALQGSFSTRLRKRFERFSFVSILLAGLIDGINPCAIATMIFLISFLATRKRKRSEVLIIGLAFTVSVFFTYLAMGIGAFKALTFLQKYIWISTVIRWSAAAVAFIIGLLSFKDAYVYKKTGKTSDIALQLPKAVKMRIHGIISGNLSGGSLVIGAVITGFLVTLLEAVCTGQVYLPTIVLMTRQEGLRITGWLYLLMYNFLFVLPLIIVMIGAWYGMQWKDLAGITRKNLTLMKVLPGTLLCGLGLFILFAM